MYSISCFSRILAALMLLSGFELLADGEFMKNPVDRKKDRPAELWRYYMHGVGDFFATPVTPVFKKVEKERGTIITPYFKHEGEVFRLEPGQVIQSEALDVDLSSFKGRELRVFYWMRCETVDSSPASNSYSDAPQLLVVLRDAAGRQLSSITSHNGAVGEVPWHGYYRDIHISPRAATMHLRLRNSDSRRAWYGRFSWEAVNASNSYTQNEKQEPETGSLAAFPWYEPINFHLFAKPPATRHVWNFFRGPAAGMTGQPYDLTRLEGLRRYYRESVKVDLDQMNHGIMYFPMRYHQGMEAGVLPEMEKGWLEEIGRLVVADQDPVTGYWGTKALPHSMSVTFHFLDMLFAFGIERYDEPAIPDSRRCIAPTLPHPERIVATTLKLQSTYEVDGRREPAAWNQAAYNFTDNPDASKSACALGTSMNAIRMLRICRGFVGEEMRRDIDVAVKAGFRYIMDNCVGPDWVWRQQDVDKVPSKPDYFMNIIDFSHYLEKRHDSGLAVPELAAERSGDGVRIACRKWLPGQNSFRIYAVDGAVDGLAGLKTGNIVAIISRGDARPTGCDPLIAVRNCVNAGKANWKLKLPSHSRVVREMKALSRTLITGSGDKEVTVPFSMIPSGGRLAATAVDWYGAESLPVAIP